MAEFHSPVNHGTTGAPDVTVVMVPRERFSRTRESIDSLYRDPGVPFAFICVDGGSPRSVAQALAEESRRRGFRLIRTEHFLMQNEARNLAIPQIEAKYVAFVDNDVEFAPGWLAALRRCAEETGADIVSPIVCWGEPAHTTVHFAGGDATIELRDGERRFRESHRFYNEKLADVRADLVRQPCELAEFHCMLVRRDVFDRVGLLDEELKSIFEHVDFCMSVRAAGGSVMFEPNALVTYVMEARLGIGDLLYYFYRWNDDWSLASESYFHRKWNSVYTDEVTTGFTRPHRRRVWPSLRKRAQRVVGWRRSIYLYDVAANLFIWAARRRQSALAPPRRLQA